MGELRPKFRKEYKYYVSVVDYLAVLHDLTNFVRIDANAASQSGFYGISSIYFENLNLRSYYDKIDGHINRFKMRMRFYNQSLKNSVIKAEFKYKFFDDIFKRYAEISPKIFKQILSNEKIELDDLKDFELKRFLMIRQAENFWPFIRIDYDRQAFFSKMDRDIRITFDRNVQCSRIIDGRLDRPMINVFPPDKIILEIKTPDRFPFWLAYIIKKYGLKRISISKYVLAVQNLAANSALVVK